MDTPAHAAAPGDDRVAPELPPVAPAPVRKLCWLGLGLLVAWFALSGAASVYNQSADLEYFYKAGAWLWNHGDLDQGYDILPDGSRQARGSIEWYLPFMTRFMTSFAWAPYWLGGGLWLTMNLLAFVATVRMIGRYMTGLPPQDWPVTQLLLVLLGLLYWSWEFRLNQINNLTLCLLVASFVLWQRGRHGVAGFWLGLAVLLKLTPGLIVLWFLLKRQFRTVAVAMLTVILAGPVGDLIVFGPQHTLGLYQRWAQIAVTKSSQTGLILNQLEMDWRNQSLGAVASRWLHKTNYATHFDNDPRIRYPDEPRYMNIANLPLTTVARIVTAIAVVTLLGLCWIARKPARELTTWQLRAEWTLFVLAMLWLMPVMRRYHLIWTLPAVSVLAAAIHYSAGRSPWARVAGAGIALLAFSQLLVLERSIWDTKYMEGGGVLLFGLAGLGAAVVTLLVRLRRNPAALPADPFVAPALARAPARAPTFPPATAASAHA